MDEPDEDWRHQNRFGLDGGRRRVSTARSSADDRRSAFAAAAQSQSNQPVPQFDGASEIEEVEVLGDWRSRRRHSQGGHTAYRRSADQKKRRIRLYDATIYRSDRTETAQVIRYRSFDLADYRTDN